MLPKRRPELERVLDELESGDALVVTKLDRLARSRLDLLRIIDLIGKEGAGFKSLGDPWADTTTSHGHLIVTVLSGIAQFEREIILSRISDGRKRARGDGVKFGRKPKLTDYQRQEALERLAQGETQSTIARTFNVDRATISRLARSRGSE